MKNENEQTRLGTLSRKAPRKRTRPQADTNAPEVETDRLVYELYGLTEEEIKVVEGK